MIKGTAGLVPGARSLPGLQMAAISACPCILRAERAEGWGKEKEVYSCNITSHKDTIYTDLSLAFTNLFNLNYLHTGPISKCSNNWGS